MDTLERGTKIESITPKIALEYLQYKKEYEKKDFLQIWHRIIPIYFSKTDFCKYIDDLRTKMINNKSIGGENEK